LPGYGVRLSAELEAELRRQSRHIWGEFLAVCDKLQCLASSRPVEHGQLKLPGLATGPDHPETRPFGFNGWIVYQVVGEGEVEIVDVGWPTEVDQAAETGS